MTAPRYWGAVAGSIRGAPNTQCKRSAAQQASQGDLSPAAWNLSGVGSGCRRNDYPVFTLFLEDMEAGMGV